MQDCWSTLEILQNERKNELITELASRLSRNASTSICVLENSNDSVSKLPWLGTELFNLKIANEVFFFLPDSAQRISAILDQEVAPTKKLAPNKTIVVCCANVLVLSNFMEDVYPFSQKDVANYVNSDESGRVYFPNGKSNQFYLIDTPKTEFEQFAEYCSTTMDMIIDTDELDQQFKDFCRKIVPITKSLINGKHYIFTDIMKQLQESIESLILKREQLKEIVVFHYPCMGGTTTARVTAMSLCEAAPVLLLNNNFVYKEKFRSIVEEMNKNCSVAVTIIADNIDNAQYLLLKRNLERHRVVLLKFERVEEAPPKNSILISKLSQYEKKQFDTLYKQLSEKCENKDVSFLYIGLLYLHEEYRLQYQMIFLDKLKSASQLLQRIFYLLAIFCKFGNGSSTTLSDLSLFFNQSINIEDLDEIFLIRPWLKQFIEIKNDQSISLCHVLVATVIFTQLDKKIVVALVEKVIDNTTHGNYNTVVAMICHVKGAKFSKLIEYLGLDAKTIFHKALDLNNYYCNTQYCKWLAFEDVEMEKQFIEQVVEMTEKLVIRDHAVQSTIDTAHGDTYRYMYSKTNVEEDALKSVTYYQRALVNKQTNSHAALGLCKIILKYLIVTKFEESTVRKLESILTYHPLEHLFSMYITSKFINSDYILPFVKDMEIYFFTQQHEYKTYFALENSIPQSKHMEVLEKWNLYFTFYQTGALPLNTLSNEKETLIVPYMCFVEQVTDFLNGKSSSSDVVLAQQELKSCMTDKTVLPITYFTVDQQVFHFSIPHFQPENEVTISHFDIKQHHVICKKLETVRFTDARFQQCSAAKLWIDAKGNVICKAF